MKKPPTKQKQSELVLIITLLVLLSVTLLLGLYLWLRTPATITVAPVVEEENIATTTTELPPVVIKNPKEIGRSIQNHKIESYTFGNGEETVIFVGGIHGGYEWNSTLLAYSFIDAVESGEITIPANLHIEVIPTLNPDGLYDVIGKEGRFAITDINDSKQSSGYGRLNAASVDLNRNFACKWQPTSTWRGNTVSAGTAPFSEPESLALKNLVETTNPKAVIFWHSQAGAVYASECEKGVLPSTITLMNTYATAGGYKAVPVFDAYPITGDAEGWLASLNIPAITVELTTHDTVEWPQNKKAVEAVLELYKGN